MALTSNAVQSHVSEELLGRRAEREREALGIENTDEPITVLEA
jgi:hypothetical protein